MRYHSKIAQSVCIASLFAVALQGCAELGAQSRVDPATIAVYPGGEDRVTASSGREPDKNDTTGCGLLRGMGSYSRGAVDLDCFIFPEDSGNPVSETGTKLVCERFPRGEDELPTGLSCVPVVETRGNLVRLDRSKLAYSKAVNDLTSRNRLTAFLMKQSDDVCIRELGMLTSNQAAVNASLNTLATAATTAANIVTGDQAKSILTGASTLSGAARSHLNADVYRNTVAHAISRAIVLERKRLRDAIEARYSQSNVSFTVDDAIRAANEYHGVCSFFKGLELVLASVEGDQRAKDTQQRREQIDELERQINRYRSMLAGKVASEDAKTYTDNIKALLDQMQRLSLAGIPNPAPPTDGAQTQGQNDQAVQPAAPTVVNGAQGQNNQPAQPAPQPPAPPKS